MNALQPGKVYQKAETMSTLSALLRGGNMGEVDSLNRDWTPAEAFRPQRRALFRTIFWAYAFLHYIQLAV